MGVYVDGVEYDVAIERSTGEQLGFMIVPHSDRRERINDWAPNISTTGELAYAEGVWRPWTQSDWSGGLGQEVWDQSEQTKFYEAEGVETRIKGKVMMATAVTVGDAGVTAAQPVDHASYIFMRSTASPCVRRYEDGVGWTNQGTVTLADPATDLIVYGTSLYIASAASSYSIRNAAGDYGLGPVDREHFATWNPGATPSLYGSHGHQIFASTDGTTWGAAISVGDSSSDITSLTPFAQSLYIGKEDGLFYYDGTDVVQMIDCRNRIWSGNFCELAEWEGYLYFNILRRIYKYSESAIIDITPNMYGDLTKESYDYGIPKALVVSPTALYVAFDLAENDYPCVLAYTGLGWHPVYKGTSGDTMYGMGYSAELDWLLINDGNTRYRQLVSMTDYPYPAFGGATGVLTFAKFDGAMPQTPKAAKSVTLHTRDCSATEKITVQYRKDGATAWEEVGDVTSSPHEEISLAPLAGALEVTSDIQIQLILSTGTIGLSPVLEHFTLQWLPRPEAIYAHLVSLRLGTPIPLG